MKLTGSTALITGASGGIGQAIARRLTAAGSSLTLSGRRADVLEPLAEQLGARLCAADLADRAAVDRLAEDCLGLDILVANAALPASGDLASFVPHEIDRALDVNLRAPIILARAMSAAMAERGRGHIVLISSSAGKTGSPGSSLYSATKFGLRGFGQGLRGDLHGTGVGVSVIFPGFIRDAGMLHDSGVQLPGFAGTSTPDDVADAVVRAIERNRGEVDVDPITMRAGTKFAQLAPASTARLTRLLGSDQISRDFASGQRDKR